MLLSGRLGGLLNKAAHYERWPEAHRLNLNLKRVLWLHPETTPLPLPTCEELISSELQKKPVTGISVQRPARATEFCVSAAAWLLCFPDWQVMDGEVNASGVVIRKPAAPSAPAPVSKPTSPNRISNG